MNLVFFCQSCGARFEVPPTSAGKKGRCKSCGQMMTVPRAQELASMVALPALAPAAVGAGGPAAARGTGEGKSLAWLAAASSNVALAPLTVDDLPIGGARKPPKPKYDDDLGDSKPYQLAEPLRPSAARPSGRVASGAKIFWRRNLGGVAKLFRKMNETAYLVSVPFLLMIPLGAIVRSRPLALAGASAAVLLNIGRIAAGVANLAVVPFREGIFQGVTFLIPPLTFFYLANHWERLKRPTLRIVGPIATIVLVFVAFALIPTLRKDGKMLSAKNLKDELRNDARELEGEMIGEVNRAKSLDVESLGKQAGKALSEAAGKINSVGQPGGTGQAP